MTRQPLNRTVRRWGVLAAAGLALAACGGGGGDRPPEPGDVAVARVGDRTVWRSDVKREAVAQRLITEGEPLDPNAPMFRRVLDEVIDQRLLAAEAERRGLARGAEGERRVAAARDRVLGDMLIEQAVAGAVNEQAVQALYREQLRLSQRGEQLRGRQIVTRTQEEAAAVRRRRVTGAAFDQLAVERSIDAGSRFNGGDLGYFTVSSMPPEYARALTGATAGQTVGPFAVAPRDGAGAAPTWVVLRLQDRRQQPPMTLQEARPQIRRFLTFDQISELIQTLRRGSEIRYLVRAAPGEREPASATPNANETNRRPQAGAAPAPSPGTAAPETAAGPAAR